MPLKFHDLGIVFEKKKNYYSFIVANLTTLSKKFNVELNVFFVILDF